LGGGPRQQDFGARLKASTAAPFRAWRGSWPVVAKMQTRATINLCVATDPSRPKFTCRLAERVGLTRAVPALALRAPSRRRSGVLHRLRRLVEPEGSNPTSTH